MKRQDHRLAAWQDVFRLLFDSSPAQVALLDLDAQIVQTNLAWKQFGRENGLPSGYDCVGKNYLEILEPAANNNEIGARQTYNGLLEVLRIQRPKFTLVYPCHSPTERRWYRLWIEPQSPEIPGVIVAHYFSSSKPLLDNSKPSAFGSAILSNTYIDAGTNPRS